MSKKLLSISLACMMLVFTNCKKDNSVVPATVVPKVKTFTISNGSTVINTVTLEYDNAARRSKIIYTDGSWINFSYTGNTMLQESFNSAGTSQNKYTYNLNIDGLADSYFANASPTIIVYETYNTAKRILSDITKNNGVITSEKYYMYDNLGNLSGDSSITSAGTTTKTYEYYSDKISTIENSNLGASYNGVGNKNSQKKLTVKNPSNIITVYDYSVPEMDAQGRVTKQSYTEGFNTISSAYTYY
ncbi:MAG: hypothetical protein ABIP79_00510 [Chitinophagaceae bacterium]